MLKCEYRGKCYNKPYCTRDGGYCTTKRWIWCKGIVMGIVTSIAIAYFAYGIVYAWQNVEDRVDLLKKIEANKIAEEERMDELELRLKEYNKTMVGHWLWQLKEWEKLNGKAAEEITP